MQTKSRSTPSFHLFILEVYDQPMMISLEEALDRILPKFKSLGCESVDLSAAEGRVLSRSLVAGISLPPWDNSAMDGYAVQAEDVSSASKENPVQLTCLGEAPAGSMTDIQVQSGTCLRIFTGSPMPKGADAVVMQEDTQRSSGEDQIVRVFDSVKPFEFVRFKGEDVKEGDQILSAGTRLSGFHISLAFAAGLKSCEVFSRPRVGILATGSELCEPGQPLTAGGIYESNRILLKSLVQHSGCEPFVYPIVEDSLEATCAALSSAVKECDVLVTSGGVSVGDYDFIKPAFELLGGQIDFWRIRIKPGKPLVFGEIDSVPVFGLPGNPVSATVTFTILVHPALQKMNGLPEFHHSFVQGELTENLNNPGNRRLYLRVQIDADGSVCRSGANQASHALGSLAVSDGVVAVTEGATLAKGSKVKVLLWPKVS